MTTPELLRTRLAELQREYQEGESQLRAIVQQEAGLRETLLRISGAVQVLQELLSAQQPVAGHGADAQSGPTERGPLLAVPE